MMLRQFRGAVMVGDDLESLAFLGGEMHGVIYIDPESIEGVGPAFPVPDRSLHPDDRHDLQKVRIVVMKSGAKWIVEDGPEIMRAALDPPQVTSKDFEREQQAYREQQMVAIQAITSGHFADARRVLDRLMWTPPEG
jgi:hypothetical protein